MMVANIAALTSVAGVGRAIVDPDVASLLLEVARGVALDVPDVDPDVERGAVLPPVAISRRSPVVM